VLLFLLFGVLIAAPRAAPRTAQRRVPTRLADVNPEKGANLLARNPEQISENGCPARRVVGPPDPVESEGVVAA
jgi:hypothetical protein